MPLLTSSPPYQTAVQRSGSLRYSLACRPDSLALVVLVLLSMLGCSRLDSELAAPAEGALRVATWNVHYINLNEATGAWSVADWHRRKGPMDRAFKAMDADLVAFQEMESFAGGDDDSVNLTREWLLKNNPAYRAAAVGDWREFPSTQPILYRHERLSPIDQGWFFFSETPDVIYSRTFDGSYPAFASWAKFQLRESGKAFRIVNVHFEFKSFSNRRLSAELVAERIEPWIEAGERVLLAGDLNAWRFMQPVSTLEAAGLDFQPVSGATYHFNIGFDLIGAIDHLALSEGLNAVGEPVVVRRRFAGEWPSDHYPVVLDLQL